MISNECSSILGFDYYESIHKYISKIFTDNFTIIINIDGMLCLSRNAHFFQFYQ